MSTLRLASSAIFICIIIIILTIAGSKEHYKNYISCKDYLSRDTSPEISSIINDMTRAKHKNNNKSIDGCVISNDLFPRSQLYC